LEMVDRLEDDHRRARELARLIGAEEPHTNIVAADLGPGAVERLESEGVRAMEFDGRIRFVTHRLISDDDVASAADAVRRST